MCFVYAQVKGAARLVALADRGPSVTFQIPVFRLGWAERFLGSILNKGGNQGAIRWGFNLEATWIDQSSRVGFSLPGGMSFYYAYNFNVGSRFSYKPGGIFQFRATGSRSDSVLPMCDCNAAIGASGTCGADCAGLTVSVEGKFIAQADVVSDMHLVHSPVIRELWMEIKGEMTVPVWMARSEIGIKGFSIGFWYSIDVTAGMSFTAQYIRDAGSSIFGIPIRLDSVAGAPLYLGASGTGGVSLGPGGASVKVKSQLGPIVRWTAADGLKWVGLNVQFVVAVRFEAFVFSVTKEFLTISKDFSFKKRGGTIESFDSGDYGLSKRGVGSIDESHSFANATRIVNRWSPVVTSLAAPFVIDNVYPSAYIGVASIGNVDVMAWSSFDNLRASPNDLQVQYVWRQHGGNWSAPSYIPGSELAVGMPVLEDLESTGQIMLVAAQVMNPDTTDFELLETRLMYTLFDMQTYTWGPYVPMFATQPSVQVSDWLPVFTETGLWMSFLRSPVINAPAALLSTRFVNGQWTAPEVVLPDVAHISAWSMDANLNGNALIGFTTTESSNMNLCS